MSFVIKPAAIGTAQLVSTTAIETVAAYDPAANYARGVKVRVDADRRIYESLQANNTGNTPSINPDWWLDLAPTNTWAMFDNQVSTTTTAENSLSVTLAVGYSNSIGLFGLVGTSLLVEVRDGAGGPVVYSQIVNLDGTVIADWYAYYFEPSDQLSDVVLSDLPPYLAAHVTVTITGPDSVGVGHCSLGTAYDLGCAQFGVQVELVDYSRVETDEFGETTFVRRKSAKNIGFTALMEVGQMRSVFANLNDLRGTPAVYAVSNEQTYDLFLAFGVYRGARIVVPGPTHATVALDIKGLA